MSKYCEYETPRKVSVHVHVHLHVCMCICMCVCVCVCMCMCVCVCMCMCVCMHCDMYMARAATATSSSTQCAQLEKVCGACTGRSARRGRWRASRRSRSLLVSSWRSRPGWQRRGRVWALRALRARVSKARVLRAEDGRFESGRMSNTRRRRNPRKRCGEQRRRRQDGVSRKDILEFGLAAHFRLLCRTGRTGRRRRRRGRGYPRTGTTSSSLPPSRAPSPAHRPEMCGQPEDSPGCHSAVLPPPPLEIKHWALRACVSVF